MDNFTMRLSVTITMLPDGRQTEERLAVIPFSPEFEGADVFGIQQEVQIRDTTPVKVGASYSASARCLNLAVFHAGQQLSLTHWQWEKIAPYFGLRLLGFGFMHFFFERSE
jgi:hypothetical protein